MGCIGDEYKKDFRPILLFIIVTQMMYTVQECGYRKRPLDSQDTYATNQGPKTTKKIYFQESNTRQDMVCLG